MTIELAKGVHREAVSSIERYAGAAREAGEAQDLTDAMLSTANNRRRIVIRCLDPDRTGGNPCR